MRLTAIIHSSNNLVSELKIVETYEDETKKIKNKIPTLSIYLFGSTTFEKINIEEIKKIKTAFDQITNEIQTNLKKIIKNN